MISKSTSILRALAAAAGEDTGAEMRSRMSMAIDVGMDPDEAADAVLRQVFVHLEHNSQCGVRRTSQLVWQALVTVGITEAFLYANDEANHGGT